MSDAEQEDRMSFADLVIARQRAAEAPVKIVRDPASGALKPVLDPNYAPLAEYDPDGVGPKPFLKPAMDVVLAKMDEIPVLPELPVPFIYNPVPSRVIIHPDLEKEWLGGGKD